MSQRVVLADYDDDTIFVYQAYNDRIAIEALSLGRFGPAFSRARMSWIKPSFGWMLYRSGYATKENQTRILRIRMTRPAWDDLLAIAVVSKFVPALHVDETNWKAQLEASDVRVQWDPDRDLRLRELPHRAIQVGIGPKHAADFALNWIVGLEDVTDLAARIRRAAANGEALPAVPLERPYPVNKTIMSRIGAELPA